MTRVTPAARQNPFAQVRGLTDNGSSCMLVQGARRRADRTRVPSARRRAARSRPSVTARPSRRRSAGGLRCLVAAAVLTGQLSIGWCNDLLDRDRDRAAGRTDKPLATGRSSAPAGRDRLRRSRSRRACRSRWPAAGGPGWRTSSAVAGGWAYDLGLKRTVLSWLPVRRELRAARRPSSRWACPGTRRRRWWLVAGALLGTGAHFLNVVPDVEADLAAGVRGLPQRLGRGAGAPWSGAVLLAGRGRRRHPRPRAAAVVGLGRARRRRRLRGRRRA